VVRMAMCRERSELYGNGIPFPKLLHDMISETVPQCDPIAPERGAH
jgi:hypothetical protein